MEEQSVPHWGGRIRPRRTFNCEPCRKRKLRCDRNRPCSNCLRSRNQTCSYPLNDKSLTATEPGQARSLGTLGHEGAPNLNLPPLRPPPTTDSRVAQPGPNARGLEPTSSLTPETWHSSTLGSMFVSGQSPGPLQPETTSARSYSTTVADPLARVTTRPEYQSQGQSAIDPSCSGWIQFLSNLPHPIRGIMIKGRYVGQSHWVQLLSFLPP